MILSFLELTESFLNCKVDYLPFNYLGLPADANLRREGTWEPFLKFTSKRIDLWKNKFVSLGWEDGAS